METAVYGQLQEVGLRLLARDRFCGHSGLSWRAGLKEDSSSSCWFRLGLAEFQASGFRG